MFLSKLWSVSERIPPFLLFSTLIHEIVQTLVDYSRKLYAVTNPFKLPATSKKGVSASC